MSESELKELIDSLRFVLDEPMQENRLVLGDPTYQALRDAIHNAKALLSGL